MTPRITAELAQLAHLARDGGLDLSQVSLRVKADLLMSMPQPPDADLAAFSEIATALAPQINDETAIILARKLAGWRHAPRPVLAALQARGGPVLAALLRHGMTLPASELEDLAEHGAIETAHAMAERSDLTSTATLLLVDRADRALDLALIANASAPLPRAALDLLVARARMEPAYAQGLLARGDLSNAELTPLFLQAGTERRNAILESLAAIDSLNPTERRASVSAELFSGWLATAGDDHRGAFGAIAEHLRGGQDLADALHDDRSRDLAALALVASGVGVEDATRFLIRLGDATAHSVPRIFALVGLMREVRPGVALRIVMQVAGGSAAPSARKGQHQPAMAPGGTPSRAGAVRQDSPQIVSEIMRKFGLRR
jgi:uncharacterized protein (DUF2336 family)